MFSSPIECSSNSPPQSNGKGAVHPVTMGIRGDKPFVRDKSSSHELACILQPEFRMTHQEAAHNLLVLFGFYRTGAVYKNASRPDEARAVFQQVGLDPCEREDVPGLSLPLDVGLLCQDPCPRTGRVDQDAIHRVA